MLEKMPLNQSNKELLTISKLSQRNVHITVEIYYLKCCSIFKNIKRYTQKITKKC